MEQAEADDINNPTSSFEKISEELDRLLIRQLELIQEYVNLSRESEVHQKDGYMNLAKSRYIQGSQSISKVRLPTEDSEEYAAVITVTNASNILHDPVVTSSKHTIESSAHPMKRKICTESGASAEAKLLRQFGILSSSSVKTAQKSFRKSIEVCIDRINVAEELFTVQQRFNLLHKVKKDLSVTDNGIQP